MKGDWDAARDPLAALRAGDGAPFEAFVRTEAPTLVAFFRRLGASTEEAEDLTQETFLKMFHARDRYEPRERVAAYTFRVARNAWFDHRRRAAARPPSAPGTGPEGRPAAEEGRELPGPGRGGGAGLEPDPAAVLAHREEHERLRAAVARLPELHRAVFELGVLQELRYEEIGRLLEIPVGTVKSRMFHAVRKLREALEAEALAGARRPGPRSEERGGVA